MPRAASRPVLALAAALLLAGCGDDAGDPRGFARDADHACGALSTAVQDLRDGLRRDAATSQTAGLATAITRYATSVRRTADGLARTRPPGDEVTFRDAAVAGLRRHAGAMRRAAGEVREQRAAGSLGDEVRGGGLPAVPASVLADAPACRRVQR